ncbi:glutamate receptor 3 [Biomphalaria pfeifferi]|uniref:Glutamate receptor 3 n=1 Tax=Biomphalaria pfeifferi TaxID=112525 RepID=A0AAD8BU02_BIOPF|nr:glutamate receptor 3 [Biomphalaria pfeifferi]
MLDSWILFLTSVSFTAVATERQIGLILQDDPPTQDQHYEQAFDFATMVINNNLLKELRHERDQARVYNTVRNKTIFSDNYKLGGAICGMASEGVSVIVGTSLASSFNTIQSYCQALRLPYILATPSRPSLLEGYQYDVSICPPYVEAVMKVVANLTLFENKIFYVYDSDDGLWRIQRLYQLFQRKDINPPILDAFRIRDVKNSYTILRSLDLKQTLDKTIVLDLSSTEAYKVVLEQIVDVGMNRENYHYILAGADAMDLNLDRDFFAQFIYGGVDITAFQFLNNRSETYRKWQQIWEQYKDQYPDLFPLKTGSALMMDAVLLLHKALTSDLQKHKSLKENAVRTCDASSSRYSDGGSSLLSALNGVQFEGLTGPVVMNNGRRTQYSMDVYKLRFKEPMRKETTWQSSDFQDLTFKPYSPETAPHNKTWKVATVIEPPFVMPIENRNGAPPMGPNLNLEGYCIDLIEALARSELFEYQVYLADDYGDKNETDGTWNGIIGQLISQERDIAVAPLTITQDRERVVDFTKPFMDTGISIMIKKPDKTKPGVFSFMDPLDTRVWLCIAIGFLAVSFVLYFVGRFSPYEWSVCEDAKERTATTVFSITNTLWFSLGALMQQGSDISPRSISGRVIGSAWWFFTLIIISSYTANLAAFLTIEKLVVSISSADDLVGHPTIKYGTKRSGTSWRFFEKSTVDKYVTMRNEMLANADEVLFSEYHEGVKKVRESKSTYAFLLESAMNTYYGQQEPCDTMMVGEKLDYKGYGVASTINFPLRNEINIAVLTLKEKGELIKLQQKWWYDKGKCGDQSVSKESTGTQNALTLSNVSGIFHILIGGLVLAMVTSSLEYFIQRKLRKRRSHLKMSKSYILPNPPPPPQRLCFGSTSNRASVSQPVWENGHSSEAAAAHEREDLMSNDADGT